MELFRDTGRWFTDYWTELGSLFFAAVVAWTAWVGVKLNRRLIDAELDPAITVYLEQDPMHFSFLILVIKNAGRGVARNIRFAVKPDIPVEANDPSTQLSRLAVFDRGISIMAPMQEIRTFYGAFPELTREPIDIYATYERDSPESRQRSLRANFVLDVTLFEGLSQVGDPPELSAAQSLNKMAADIEKIRMGGSRSNVTVIVKRHYIFSNLAHRIRRRWFGERYLNSTQSPWQHFRKELYQTIVRRWRRTLERRR